MQDFPHHYRASASGLTEGDVDVETDRVVSIPTAPPPEFGGPGDRWSPESLLVAAVANCFILTFRAIARASRLTWTALRCDVVGTLDHQDRVTRFTRFEIHATLKVPAGTDEAKTAKLLEKAETGCLITNSLTAQISLEYDVDASEPDSLLEQISKC